MTCLPAMPLLLNGPCRRSAARPRRLQHARPSADARRTFPDDSRCCPNPVPANEGPGGRMAALEGGAMPRSAAAASRPAAQLATAVPLEQVRDALAHLLDPGHLAPGRLGFPEWVARRARARPTTRARPRRGGVRVPEP